MVKKSKPTFNVLNHGKKRRVKARWRKPRGIDNKKRIRRKEFGASPKVGYKNSKTDRGMHPLGIKEIMICNIKELIDNSKKVKEKWVARISGKVSKRNKLAIKEKAKELKIKTAN
ncbi:MAG: eL32 family ribosomal protein [Candidatus ainarchaeum sp.]|nr:eL32 family ribosomal protein [Candidatus ainarchaeum sp.]